MAQSDPHFLSAAYWDKRYREQETGWDIGYPSTPLKNYIDQLQNKSVRILIPGAGNGYEAVYLAEQGFTNITIIDISSVLTTQLKQKINPQSYPAIRILTGDFFDLEEEFDLIFEQTFFCAIDPSLRESYVKKMRSLLSGNGKLVGLLFNRDFDANPPFGGNKEDYRQLFEPQLRITKLEACYNSIPKREGTELFVIFQKNPD
jgi:SAM-dependent methyltransferase